MIVKVQISISSSDDKSRALVYDESREYMYETEKPDEVKAMTELLGDQPKGYFEADIDGMDQIVITGEAPWQDW